MNVCTRIALVSSLSAVASIGLLTTEAKAFQLQSPTVKVNSVVDNPFAGDDFSAFSVVNGKATTSWSAKTTGGGTGNLYFEVLFLHANQVIQSFTKEYLGVSGSGAILGETFSYDVDSLPLAPGDYVTSIKGTLFGTKNSNPFFAYKTDLQGVQYSVAPVPEPLTIIGSGIALGFGGFLKRKQKVAQNKS
jgi:hypothetical protein